MSEPNFKKETEEAAEGMIQHGKTFFLYLGHMLEHATTKQAKKIHDAFTTEWNHFRILYLNSQEKR